jgi:hypothetical protein
MLLNVLAATASLRKPSIPEREPAEGFLRPACHRRCWLDRKSPVRSRSATRATLATVRTSSSPASSLACQPAHTVNARPSVLRLKAAAWGWGWQTAPPEAARFPLERERPGSGTTGNGTRGNRMTGDGMTAVGMRGDGRPVGGRFAEVMPSLWTDAAGGKGPRAMDRAAKRGRSPERRRRGKRQA